MSKGIYTSQSNPCSFAVEEFLKYSQLVFTDWETEKDKFNVFIGISKNGEIALGEDDEIFIEMNGTQGKITGSNPCAVLIAVYRFFKECGCRFLRPGKDGEYIAHIPTADINVKIKERATSKYRGIIIEGSCSFQNVYDVIDFSPKIGLNNYEFQFKDSDIFFYRWYQHRRNPFLENKELEFSDEDNFSKETVAKEVARLKAEVKKRGMALKTMGHGWTAYPIGLYPIGWDPVSEDEISAEAREYLAMINGKRALVNGRPFITQLCYSNPKVQEKIADYMIKYCRENPDADWIKFALADNINVICECDECRKLRISDYIVQTLNLIDRKMTEAGFLKQKIVATVYMDTLWKPLHQKVKSPDRFIFGFYPISHSYYTAVPVDNIPDGEPFPYIHNKLQRTGDIRKNFAFVKEWQKEYMGNWDIGEYHFMWAHYSDLGYQKISKILWEDIRNQDRSGFNGMEMYQPQRCATPTAMGFYTYGSTLWNKNITFEEISEDYFSHAFGKDWEAAYGYLQTLSDSFDMEVAYGENPINSVSVYKATVALASDFRKKYGKKSDFDSELERISWSNLLVHCEYIERFFGALVIGMEGNYADGQRLADEAVNWLWSIENSVQPYWDIPLQTERNIDWYRRSVEKIKSARAKSVPKKADEAPKVTENGIQG